MIKFKWENVRRKFIIDIKDNCVEERCNIWLIFLVYVMNTLHIVQVYTTHMTSKAYSYKNGNDRMAYGHLQIWHMQEKTDNNINRRKNISCLPNQVCACVFIAGICASSNGWLRQWVSVLSECDRTDISAAACFFTILCHSNTLGVFIIMQQYIVSKSWRLPSLCVCVHMYLVLLEIWFILVAFNTFIAWTTALKMLHVFQHSHIMNSERMNRPVLFEQVQNIKRLVQNCSRYRGMEIERVDGTYDRTVYSEWICLSNYEMY